MNIYWLKSFVFRSFPVLAGLLIYASPLSSQVVINEVCASNGAVIADADGEYSDWIELTNTGNEAVDLSGYCLSDDSINLSQWCLPGYSLLPGEYLVVFASGKDLYDPPQHWKTLVNRGDIFRYLLPESNIPGWRDPDFEDAAWEEGPTGIGYSDGDDATVIPSKVSLYMRSRFTISSAADIESAVLHMDYDDGFVAWLNGVEIGRSNMSAEIPDYDDLASGGREATIYSGGRPERYDIENVSGIFRDGENVLAIEVHNVSTTSSDLSAIPFLSVKSQRETGMPPPAILGLPSGTFHTSFRLDADGDSLLLSNQEGIVSDFFMIERQEQNHAFGRVEGSGDAWYLFDEPTPGRANDTQAYLGYSTDSLIFSKPGGRFTGPFQLTLTAANPDDSIFYTTDGTDPDTSSILYAAPISISSDAVVKARPFTAGYLPGRATVHSYISTSHNGLAVISLATDPHHLWDYYEGIYVMGPDANTNNPHFGANFWKEWERPVHIEMYDEDDSLAFSINAGMKIYGGYTRALPQKSMSFFARAQYGDRKIPYKLFEEAPFPDFEAFVLRNSGNDWFGEYNESGTMFRDAMMTALTKNMDVEYQHARQAVVYINGEYWGIHNIREKINEHFLAAHSGVDPDRVELLTNNQEVIIGSNDHYRALMNYVALYNLENEDYYESVKQRMDVNNFIQYELSQIYFDNTDWPGNNIKYWRPDYENGRWRWILYDTDFGFGLWNRGNVSRNTLAFALSTSGPGWPNPPWSTLLLRKLMNNNEFRHQFINTFADHINTSFRESNVDPVIDALRDNINDEMRGHTERWGGSYQNWGYRVNDLKYFASLRPGVMKAQINTFFNLGGIKSVRLDVSDSEGGAVRLNSLMLKDLPWSGSYFKGVPVEIIAIPKSGYRFTGWTGSITAENARVVIDPIEDLSITVHFEPDPYDSRADVIINEICYVPDSAHSTEDWVELYNRGDRYVDLSGWMLQDEMSDHAYIIPGGTLLPPSEYYVICRNKFRFRAMHPNVEDPGGNIGFGFSSLGDIVRLFDSERQLVGMLSYGVTDPWPVMEKGYTLSLIEPGMEGALASSWAVSDQKYGTPGRYNFTIPDGVDENPATASANRLWNYPNPFSRSTTIVVYSDRRQPVRFSVYDMQGQLKEVLAERQLETGETEITWTTSLPGGIYLLKMETPTGVQNLKLFKAE